MGLPPRWINQPRWDADPIVSLSVPSQFLFSLLFLCVSMCSSVERTQECRSSSEVVELLSLHCTMQLSPEAQEANWKRCGINPSLGELC